MHILKKLLTLLVVLVAGLAVIGLFLPDRVHIEREVAIGASPEQIFPHINSLKNWQSWSPWIEREPNINLTYSGPDAGVGAKVRWESDSQGSGSQVITASVPNQSVTTYLDFGDHGTAEAQFKLTAVENGSNVVWAFDSEFGYNLMGRYFGLMFEKWLGPDYEKGLENLKRVVEAQ